MKRKRKKNKVDSFEAGLLRQLHLVQEKPRVRVVLQTGLRPFRLSFPWVSIGRYRHTCFVFFHHRKWKSLEDAVTILKPAPPFFHTFTQAGDVCIGRYNLSFMSSRQVAQLFWMTASEITSPPPPRSMRNIDNPRDVINDVKEWPFVSYTLLHSDHGLHHVAQPTRIINLDFL